MMDPRFNIVAILMLYDVTSHCFANASNTSTPNTSAYNIITSALRNTTTPNKSTSSTFNESSENGYPILKGSLLLGLTILTTRSQKTISELKCAEYAEEIADSTEIIEFIDNIYDLSKPIALFNYCNYFKYYPLYYNSAFAGEIANLGEYPHMVALGKYNSERVFMLVCGGTLISHTWVLSVAHCTHAPNGGPSDARIGINRLTGQHYGITISIKNIVRHPDYKPPALYADIALMELATPVKFNLLIHPACLYQQFDLPLNRSHATITGWGATEIDGDQSDYLQQVYLPLIDNLKCGVQYGAPKEIPYGITSSMICAGGDVNKKDACHGDSGGPLQISENACIYHIIGITSFGRSRGVMNLPGVYTRVSHYISWIENIVWPQKK